VDCKAARVLRLGQKIKDVRVSDTRFPDELRFNLKSGKKILMESITHILAIVFFSLLPVTLHAQGTPKEKTAALTGGAKRTDV
jgi:hypothetical protein